MSFYTQKELENLGFKSIGENVLVSKKGKFLWHSKYINRE